MPYYSVLHIKADSTVWDFKYFLKEVLNLHAGHLNLPLCDYLRNIEDYNNRDLTKELICMFANALWFKSKVAEKVFKMFLLNYHPELLKDAESYWMFLEHILDYVKRVYSESYYESFLFIIATVTGIADALYRNARCRFYSHTAAILIDYFEKKLQGSFVSSGGWTKLFDFLSGKAYVNFCEMRHDKEFMKYNRQIFDEINKDCSSIPIYHWAQNLIPQDVWCRTSSDKEFNIPTRWCQAVRNKARKTSDLLNRYIYIDDEITCDHRKNRLFPSTEVEREDVASLAPEVSGKLLKKNQASQVNFPPVNQDSGIAVKVISPGPLQQKPCGAAEDVSPLTAKQKPCVADKVVSPRPTLQDSGVTVKVIECEGKKKQSFLSTMESEIVLKKFLYEVLLAQAFENEVEEAVVLPKVTPSVTDPDLLETMLNFYDALKFKTCMSFCTWKRFLLQYKRDVLAPPYNYVTTLLYICNFVIQNIPSIFKKFLNVVSAVSAAGLIYLKSGLGNVTKYTFPVLIVFFKKVLEAQFYEKGGWDGLSKFLVEEFVVHKGCDQMVAEGSRAAKTELYYHSVEYITPWVIYEDKFCAQLAKEVISEYFPNLTVEVEDSRRLLPHDGTLDPTEAHADGSLAAGQDVS